MTLLFFLTHTYLFSEILIIIATKIFIKILNFWFVFIVHVNNNIWHFMSIRNDKYSLIKINLILEIFHIHKSRSMKANQYTCVWRTWYNVCIRYIWKYPSYCFAISKISPNSIQINLIWVNLIWKLNLGTNLNQQ